MLSICANIVITSVLQFLLMCNCDYKYMITTMITTMRDHKMLTFLMPTILMYIRMHLLSHNRLIRYNNNK